MGRSGYCRQKITQHTTKHNSFISQYADIDYSMVIRPIASKIEVDRDHVIVYVSYMDHCFVKLSACEVGASGDSMSHYSTFARYRSGKMSARHEEIHRVFGERSVSGITSNRYYSLIGFVALLMNFPWIYKTY